MSVPAAEIVSAGQLPLVRATPRIVALTRHTIAYDRCFYAALERLGVQVVEGQFEGTWLTKQLEPGDYVHLQWPSFLYASAGTRRRLLVSFARFVVLLLLVRARGARLVWTAHNLMPHDPAPFPGMDHLGRRIVIALSHRVFVHGPSAAAVVAARFPHARRKIVLIQHGPLSELYPRTRSRSEARIELGIPPDEHVFLFIGLCKEYKNLDGLIQAFRAMPADSLLLIAGEFQRDDYRRRILALAEGHDRIRLHPHLVPDDRIQDYLLACDCVALPYLQILTSGAAMLALSFGRPVLSVDRGFLKDVVSGETGVLFDPAEPDGLTRALIEARARRFDEGTILTHARTFSWTDSARAFIEALDA